MFRTKLTHVFEAQSKNRRAFTSENIKIRLTHRYTTLRTYLNRKPINEACKISGCKLNDPTKCTRKKVVYKIKCSTCHQYYIGSTIRALHLRMKEHLHSEQSSVFQHQKQCKSSSFSCEILATAEDQANLRLKEALLIKKMKETHDQQPLRMQRTKRISIPIIPPTYMYIISTSIMSARTCHFHSYVRRNFKFVQEHVFNVIPDS